MCEDKSIERARTFMTASSVTRTIHAIALRKFCEVLSEPPIIIATSQLRLAAWTCSPMISHAQHHAQPGCGRPHGQRWQQQEELLRWRRPALRAAVLRCGGRP